LPHSPAGGWIRRRQTDALPECHLKYTTSVWASCRDVLHQFNISLAYFQKSNPEVGPNCANFAAGDTYCIFRGMIRQISVVKGGLRSCHWDSIVGW
jgi:hypothetical protein